MEPVQLLTETLAETLGKPSEEITAILFKKNDDDGTLTDQISENAQAELQSLFVQKFQGIQGELTQAERDKLHQQAKFEALSKEEDKVRKKYGITDSKAKLDGLIDEVIARASKQNNSDDAVLIHPLYQGLKTQSESEREALVADYEAKLLAKDRQVERKMRFNDNIPLIDEALIAAGVSLEDVRPAAKQAFLAQFEAFDFAKNETGTYLTDIEGNVIKDVNLNPVKLDGFVLKDASRWFSIEKQPARQAPGNDPNQPPAPTKQTKWKKDDLPKTEAEFHERFHTIPQAEKAEFYAAYLASKS